MHESQNIGVTLRMIEKYEVKSLRELTKMCDIRHAALCELNKGNRRNIKIGIPWGLWKRWGFEGITEIIDFVEVDEEKAQAD